MFDKNMHRWIITSINKHFLDLKEDVPLYFDHYQRDQDWAELRVSGPSVNEYSRDCFFLDCIINILLTSFIGADDYKIHRMAGLFVQACTPICCYRYGDGPDDDQTQFGTLQLEPSERGKVDVVHFGIISPDNKFRRSFVEAAYKMEL